MSTLRVLLVVTLALTANAGKDLELANKWAECLREAITYGLPSAKIPGHDPLRITQNESWSEDFLGFSVDVELSNLRWYGIPFWNVSIEQLSEDSDAAGIFSFHSYWNRFILSSEFTLRIGAPLLDYRYFKGDVNSTLDGNDWKGIVNFTKPGFNLTEQINHLDLTWTVENLDVTINGLGSNGNTTVPFLGSLIKAYLFDLGVMDNNIGNMIQSRLNTAWFADKPRIDRVLKFCETH